ncbi:unnamed protein product [Owenia fusiformis]|uniref:Uncharacterized protein n=1 Tax=Owenia fusiformis TaxID=6347 RepID=A0A8J1UTQ7_OWEFU|nr:unnamed protein product [Owenia fusiformis]
MESRNCEKSEIINHERHKDDEEERDEIITINVGGIRYEVTKKTLQRYPGTKLAKLNNDDAAYRKAKDEYFFDRHPGIFNTILNVYRTGELHMESDGCGEVLKHELMFWKVDKIAFEKCCAGKFSENVGKKKQLLHFESKLNIVPPNSVKPSTETGSVIKKGCWQRVRPKVWLFLDEPFSSMPAKIFGVWTTMVVLLSIATLCLETVPSLQQNMTSAEVAEVVGIPEDDLIENYEFEFHDDDYEDSPWEMTEYYSEENTLDEKNASADVGSGEDDANYNTTDYYTDETASTRDGITKKKIKIFGSLHVKNPVLDLIDNVLYIYFAVEFVVRFIFSPNKLKFLISVHTICDIFALLPGLILYVANLVDVENKYKISILDSTRILLIMRIFRIFRLLKHSVAYQVIVYTLKASAKEVILMLGLLLLGMLVFASLMYFGEMMSGPGKSDIKSIPIACWYALVTMTTVGYGDIYPKTIGGYIVGSLCVICGVLVIAFTVPIIVNNFMMYYAHAQSLKENDGTCEETKPHPNENNNAKNKTHVKGRGQIELPMN